MTERKRYLRKLALVSLCLVVGFSLTALPKEVAITPLLDTPENRTYYNHLVEAVREAEDHIEVMMATADHYPEHPGGIQSELFDALGSASDRGAQVRVMLDESNYSEEITKTNRETASALRERGVEVKLYDPEVTNHAKLVVVDGRIVLLGSSNWNYPTYTETYQSGIKLVDEKVALFYGRVFSSLWNGEPEPEVTVPRSLGGKEIVPLVSIGENRMYYEEAMGLIKEAEESIELVIFKITRYPEFRDSKSNKLLAELVEAHDRGVEVRIILDVNTWSDDINQSNRETALWLLGQGVSRVGFDTMSATTHSKVLVVDEKSVLLGSTNWSYYSLSKNLEVDLSVRNSSRVGGAYTKYFEELWERADIPSREELSGALQSN